MVRRAAVTLSTKASVAKYRHRPAIWLRGRPMTQVVTKATGAARASRRGKAEEIFDNLENAHLGVSFHVMVRGNQKSRIRYLGK